MSNMTIFVQTLFFVVVKKNMNFRYFKNACMLFYSVLQANYISLFVEKTFKLKDYMHIEICDFWFIVY